MEVEANSIRDIQDDRNGPLNEASLCNEDSNEKQKKKKGKGSS